MVYIGWLSHDRAFNNQVTGIIVPLDKIAPVSSSSAGHTVQSTTELAFTSQWNMSLFISSPFGCQWIQSGGVWLHILRVTSIQIWMKWLSSFVRCAFSNPLGSLCSMKSWKNEINDIIFISKTSDPVQGRGYVYAKTFAPNIWEDSITILIDSLWYMYITFA